ncbi:DNA polymerase delta subunit 4 isoform X2 [Tyto alba]|uniref:DNA polymerase delta subunit 4 isoform X2 n=1 Tax=Tyto alba TaxID=56313 RepID=UPI001C662998|nr:DNA polymerase delta subunit 4 isoform X2 [Tyto alba]
MVAIGVASPSPNGFLGRYSRDMGCWWGVTAEGTQLCPPRSHPVPLCWDRRCSPVSPPHTLRTKGGLKNHRQICTGGTCRVSACVCVCVCVSGTVSPRLGVWHNACGSPVVFTAGHTHTHTHTVARDKRVTAAWPAFSRRSMEPPRRITDTFPRRRRRRSSGKVKDRGCSPPPPRVRVSPPAEATPPPSPRVQDLLEMLRRFDLTWEYGPCTGITRLQRWERAQALGLSPPGPVRDALLEHGDNPDVTYSLWHEYEL